MIYRLTALALFVFLHLERADATEEIWSKSLVFELAPSAAGQIPRIADLLTTEDDPSQLLIDFSGNKFMVADLHSKASETTFIQMQEAYPFDAYRNAQRLRYAMLKFDDPRYAPGVDKDYKTTDLLVAKNLPGELKTAGRQRAEGDRPRGPQLSFHLDPFAGAGAIDTGLYDPDIERATMSHDGRSVAVSCSMFDDELPYLERVQIWDLHTGKLLASFPGSRADFVEDSNQLAYLSRVYPNDRRLVFMSLKTFRVDFAIGSFSDFDLFDQGTRVAGLTDRGIEIWDVSKRERTALLKMTSPPSCLHVSFDGRTIFTADRQGKIWQWSRK